jgi:deoxyinosine 3'endonuclease (endonuclease V)
MEIKIVIVDMDRLNIINKRGERIQSMLEYVPTWFLTLLKNYL